MRARASAAPGRCVISGCPSASRCSSCAPLCCSRSRWIAGSASSLNAASSLGVGVGGRDELSDDSYEHGLLAAASSPAVPSAFVAGRARRLRGDFATPSAGAACSASARAASAPRYASHHDSCRSCFLSPCGISRGVPASPGVLHFQRLGAAASAASLFQQYQPRLRAAGLARPARPSPWVIGLSSSPGVPALPGVPRRRAQP